MNFNNIAQGLLNNSSKQSHDSQMLYNMFFMTIMSGIVTALVNNIPNVIDQILRFSKFISHKIWSYFFDQYKSKLTIVTTIVDDSHGVKIECSDNYDAILKKLKDKNVKKIIYVKRIKREEGDKEKKEDKKDDNNKEKEEQQCITYYFAESQVFTIDDNIKIHISNLEQTGKNDLANRTYHQQ